ncbi:MAG: C40 family peptidase [Myxococcota bacterium]
MLSTACLILAAVLMPVACASSGPGADPVHVRDETSPLRRADAVQAALSMVGAPYRYGGGSPSGFDCSGLVVYSYARAGFAGLPHSAEALEHRVRPITVDDLEPGDLLFFDLAGKKSAHVAIYVGDREFVHAPSPGKRVERVGFDHVYWGPRIERAGRIAH